MKTTTIIRLILTAAMVIGIYFETGYVTAIAATLLSVYIEISKTARDREQVHTDKMLMHLTLSLQERELECVKNYNESLTLIIGIKEEMKDRK